MNILYQSDDTYACQLGISLTSLLINNTESTELNIFILDAGISTYNKYRIIETCNFYNRKCYFLDCKDLLSKLEDLQMSPYRDSLATFLKLFVRKKLPKAIKEILYIDCDTIILGDLQDLFEIDLRDYPLAMCPDLMAYRHKQTLGFSKTMTYFNGGVILYHFPAWEKSGWEKQLFDFLVCKHASKLKKHDQDIINIVFKDHIYKLPLKYNMQSILYVADIKSYTKVYKNTIDFYLDELETAKKEQKILHFLKFIGESPWNEKSVHPHTQYYLYYRNYSLWKDIPLIREPLSPFNQLEKGLYKILPKTDFLFLFKWAHDLSNFI